MSKFNLPAIAVLDKDSLRQLSEYDFQVAVTRHAEANGYTVVYFRKSAAPGKNGKWRGLSPKGWPDLVCMRGASMKCFELKSERGRVSPEQDEMLKKLAAVKGIDCYIARPRDAAELLGLLL